VTSKHATACSVGAAAADVKCLVAGGDDVSSVNDNLLSASQNLALQKVTS